jgi:hypothetical protein
MMFEHLAICMKRTLIAIAATGIGCSMAISADAAKKAKPKAAPCTTAANVEALNVRALQTELMVGALTCGERERYNAFIQARQPELVPYAQTLQRMQGKRTNAFVTRVANAAARNADCTAISALFDEALKPGKSLSAIADKDVLASTHGYKVCAPGTAAKK